MPRLVETRSGVWMVVALAVWSVGCSDDKIVAGPGGTEPQAPAFLAIVSNAVGVAAASGFGAAAIETEVAYISLPPGAIPGGEVATIRNRRTGATLTTPVTEGGFDPVPVVTRTGDTLQVEVRVAGTTSLVGAVFGVPPRRRPIVVRTDPPPRKRDVPLNASLLIVFSEPVEPGTLNGGSVQLRRGDTPVEGTVGVVPGSPWIAAFISTSPLEPETEYQMVVTQDVRDLDGEPLEAAVSTTFTTGALIEGRIAFVSTRDGGGSPAGHLSIPYIYVANADGSGVTRLAAGNSPAWSLDGRRIAFVRGVGLGGPAEIYVMNADGSGQRFLANGSFPSWSPDGSQIVFNGPSGVQYGGIFVMNADGSGIHKLIGYEFALPDDGYGDGWVGLPAWSPDGRSIAFVRANYGIPWMIYIMNPDGTAPRLLDLPYTVGDTRSTWSPDGFRLLFQISQLDGRWGIASVNVNGSDFRSHTGAEYVGDPDWSPDGSSIGFSKFTGPGDATSSVGSRMRIFVVSTEGGSVRQLIPEAVAPALPSYWDSQPAWSRVKR